MKWTNYKKQSDFISYFNSIFPENKINKKLSTGSFATCFSTTSSNTIVKTNIIDWKYKVDPYFDGFVDWIKLSTKLNYNFIPKFDYTYTSGNYYIVVMERLKIPSQASHSFLINDILRSINKSTQYNFPKNDPTFTNNTQKQVYNQLKICYDTIHETIYENINSSVSLDLNVQNIGLRNNNELVILDPFWKK